MNVLFHLTAGFGIALALCNVAPKPKIWPTAATGAFIAFVSHALLDYTPHCYPINSKIDVTAGIISLLALTFFARKEYRLIIFATLSGSILPDLIDLLPAILNKQFNLNLPGYPKIFPWHWKIYSGSIYNGHCSTSHINIAMICIAVFALIMLKHKTVKWIYSHHK